MERVMGARDRYQSQYDRDRTGRDDRDAAGEQRRPQPRDWEPAVNEGGEDRNRYAGYYSERQYGTRGPVEREQGSRFGAEEESRYNPGYERGGHYGDERGFSHNDQHNRAWGAGRYNEPDSPYGSNYRPGRYQSGPSDYVGSSYGSPYTQGSRSTQNEGYRRDWQARENQPDGRSGYGQHQYAEPRHADGESFGEQLREAGHRIARTVKRAFRGPKGYKRSDERIREDVSDRLGEHEHLDVSEVEVNVSHGEVTLTGTVRTRQEKF